LRIFALTTIELIPVIFIFSGSTEYANRASLRPRSLVAIITTFGL
jgi:hypothetical protein